MDTGTARIPDRWVTPIRIATGLIVLLHVGLFAGGIVPRYAELTEVCDPAICEPLEPTEADVLALDELGLSLSFYAIFHIGVEVVLVAVSLLLIGLLFWRASRLWVGIVAILTTINIATTVANVVYALGEVAPEAFPLFAIADSASSIGLFLIFYIFPDGRFHPKWTLIPPLLFLPTYIISNTLRGGEFIGTPRAAYPAFFILTVTPIFGMLITGFVTQIIRYRRYYDHRQRQQTRWLIAACVGLAFGIVAWGVVFESTLIPYGPARVLSSFFGMAFLMLGSVGLIPYALTIAILRYRLWDIDLIIRRTLIYSGIMALLAAIYFGGVALLQNLFGRVTGEQSALAVVISTLGIAALFTPVRERVQGFIDRRFYRQKYDAQKTLERFGEMMRDEIDIEGVEAALLSAVRETMQPESAGLWLGDPRRRSTEDV